MCVPYLVLLTLCKDADSNSCRSSPCESASVWRTADPWWPHDQVSLKFYITIYKSASVWQTVDPWWPHDQVSLKFYMYYKVKPFSSVLLLHFTLTLFLSSYHVTMSLNLNDLILSKYHESSIWQGESLFQQCCIHPHFLVFHVIIIIGSAVAQW